MAKQWWRIDRQDGVAEPVPYQYVREAATAYYKDADLAMSGGTFATPWAVYELKEVTEGTTTAF